MKLYLEDFYHHCKAMGGATAEVMGKLLEARCDFITINVTLNSIGTSYNEVLAGGPLCDRACTDRRSMVCHTHDRPTSEHHHGERSFQLLAGCILSALTCSTRC